MNKVLKMRRILDNVEWRNRRQNLEIHDIRKAVSEYLIAEVNGVSKKLELEEMTARDVVTIDQLPTRAVKVLGAIVPFVKQTTREERLDRGAKLGRTQGDEYLLENLTSHYCSLRTAKEWPKETEFR